MRSIDPWYSVIVQLMTLMADGMATRKVRKLKTMVANSLWPLTKRWWPQTMNDTSARPIDDIATARYPKIALREKVAMMSLMIPMPGRIMM